MARPAGTNKDRIPIMEVEYTKIVLKTKNDKAMKSVTKRKLLRAYALLYCFGARISEIVNFTLDDLDFMLENKYIVLGEIEDGEGNIQTTKTGRKRRLKINTKIENILRGLDMSDCTHALFYRPKSSEPMDDAGLKKLVNTHLNTQLNKFYTSHSFRAGYITRIIEATGNIATAQAIVGHKSIQTTLKYMGTSERQIDDALDKIF
jgi:site-specific recombinase XerD